MNENAFFKTTDPKVDVVGGMELLPSWWSRMYEYAWAKQYAGKNLIVADMGAGWSGRPFKEELADTCKEVYAVDLDKRFLDLPRTRENLFFLIGNFEEKIQFLDDQFLDVVFCISVLEDLTDYTAALREFYRLLKPGGLLVITCDSKYDDEKPLPKYPGVTFPKLFDAIQEAGFRLPDDMDMSLEDAVHNDEWNLACWHMVVEK